MEEYLLNELAELIAENKRLKKALECPLGEKTNEPSQDEKDKVLEAYVKLFTPDVISAWKTADGHFKEGCWAMRYRFSGTDHEDYYYEGDEEYELLKRIYEYTKKEK